MQWRVRALCEPWPSTIVRMIDIVESVPASDCSSKPICSGMAIMEPMTRSATRISQRVLKVDRGSMTSAWLKSVSELIAPTKFDVMSAAT